MAADQPVQNLRRLTADIVAAYLSHNSIPAKFLPEVIQSVCAALSKVGTSAPVATTLQPAVPIKKSVFPDYIVCLEDGKKLKMLRRYLLAAYGMTPDEYRARWGLPEGYPMVAPDYSARRAAIAKETGLGRRLGAALALIELPPAPSEPVVPEVPVQKFPAGKRGRKPSAKTAPHTKDGAAPIST